MSTAIMHLRRFKPAVAEGETLRVGLRTRCPLVFGGSTPSMDLLMLKAQVLHAQLPSECPASEFVLPISGSKKRVGTRDSQLHTGAMILVGCSRQRSAAC